MDPAPDGRASTPYQNAIRAELNTWFQPEHPRGAWLRDLSKDRPEAAATIRQSLTELHFPNPICNPLSQRRFGLLAYLLGVTAAAICFRALPLPLTYQVFATLLTSLTLLAAGIIVRYRERNRRRLQAATFVRRALECAGEELAAILQRAV